MKRKKKKINAQQSKQEKGARLNTYKKRILQYLKIMDCEELGCLINKSNLQAMYQTRLTILPKLKFSEEVTFDNKTKRDLRSDFDFMISENSMEVFPGGPAISPKDVIGYLTVIFCIAKMKETSTDVNELRAVQQFKDNAPDLESLHQAAYKEISIIMSYAGLFHVQINERICWLVSTPKKNGNLVRELDIEVKVSKPDYISVILDHIPRPAFRLSFAFANNGPKKVSIPADKLNLSQATENISVPVYVQNHVLHRLEERLDCVPRFLREFYLYLCFNSPKIVHFNGRILVEYHLDEYHKVGYLVVEYVNGILLVKTFLLLPSIGTPEGKKLDALIGMQKTDHTYWAIDRLSTFQFSDMKENVQLKEVFEKAGCGTLFKEGSIFENEGEIHIRQAMQMLKYIDIKEEDNEPEMVEMGN
jgi:hypothetical protein